MKKLILLAIAGFAIVNFNSCKSKNADAACATAVGKYLADGKVAELQLYTIPNGDTSVKYTYSKLTTDIYKQTNTLMTGNILGSNTNSVPYYFKACGADVYVNNSGLNMDDQVALNNLFVKGNRPVGSTWNYTLNGVKYWCGCASKNNLVIFPYDTLWVDVIYMRPSPSTSVPADSIYWNDTLGFIGKQGYSGLMNKNF